MRIFLDKISTPELNIRLILLVSLQPSDRAALGFLAFFNVTISGGDLVTLDR